MNTWKTLSTAGWPAKVRGIRRSCYLAGSILTPFGLAYLVSGFFGLEIEWLNFLVHGEAAIVAIIVMAGSLLLISRARWSGNMKGTEDKRLVMFPYFDLLNPLIIGVLITAMLAYCATIITPHMESPLDLAGNRFFVTASLFLWAISVIISGAVEYLEAAIEHLDIHLAGDNEYRELERGFKETES